MRRILVLLVLGFAVVACGGKKTNEAGGTASGSAPKTAEAPMPPSCPAGNVVQAGKCVAVVTPETLVVVQQQQTRIDDLAKLLDQVELVAAPVELLDGFRQLPQWKALAAKSTKLAVADTAVATLDAAVKKLRELGGQLGEASQRLGDLRGELDKLMSDPMVVRTIEEVRAKVSSEVRAAIEPLARNLADTLRTAVAPLVTQLNDTADLVVGACAMAKLSGGGDKMKQMCDGAKAVFDKGRAFVDDFKTKPAALFKEVSTKLEAELDLLLDAAAKQAIDAAQVAVDDALGLPAHGSGEIATPGSAAGSAK